MPMHPPARSPLLSALAVALAVSAPLAAGAEPFSADLVSQAAGDGFGQSLAAGDFNDDGLIDLAVGAPDDFIDGSTGRIHIWFGGEPIARNADTFVNPPDGGFNGFGRTLAAADIDGNGVTDLVIGDDDGFVWAAGGLPGEFGHFPDGVFMVAAQNSDVDPVMPILSLTAVGNINGDRAEDVVAVIERQQDCPCDVAMGPVYINRLWVLLGEDPAFEGGLMGTLGGAGEYLDPPGDFDPCACTVDADDECVRYCDFGADVVGGYPISNDGWHALVVGAPGIGPNGTIVVYDNPFLEQPSARSGAQDQAPVGQTLAVVVEAPDRIGQAILAADDSGGVQIYPILNGQIAEVPDPAELDRLDGFTSPQFITGRFDDDEDEDLLIYDAAGDGPIYVFYGPVELPLNGPEDIIDDRHVGDATMAGEVLLVGQMTGQFHSELAIVVSDGGPDLTVRLLIDGITDMEDRDDDGVPDGEDGCPDDPDPLQTDRDGDGLNDACDRCSGEPGDGAVDGSDGDDDGVCDHDCAYFYSPDDELRINLSDELFQWNPIEPFSGNVPLPIGIDYANGDFTGEGGLPDENGQPGSYGTNAPERGLLMSFDPYANGQLPTHIGLTLVEACEGVLGVTALLADGRSVEWRVEIDGATTAEVIPLGVKHRDGFEQLRLKLSCRGEPDANGQLAIDDVQIGRTIEPVPCLPPPGEVLPTDNCPETPNPNQRDSDGDGLGDACDCPGGDVLTPAGDCVRALTIRGLGGADQCEDAGDLSGGPAYAHLRDKLNALGHEVEQDVNSIDGQSASETDVFFVVGEQGDGAVCALEAFVRAGGSVLDIRDFDRSLFDAAPSDQAVPAGRSFNCRAGQGLGGLCDGVGEVLHGGARAFGDGYPGAPILVDQNERTIAVAVLLEALPDADPDTQGRAIIVADGSMGWGKTVCAEGAGHDPDTARFVLNAVDFLARGSDYDDGLGNPLIQSCIRPPSIGLVAQMNLDAGTSSGLIPVDISDTATPVDALRVSITTEPPGVLDEERTRVRWFPDEQTWQFELHGGPAEGQADVTISVIDGDGLGADARFQVMVLCPNLDNDEDCDALDDDIDGDGLGNDLEVERGTDPTNLDSDGDGLDDGDEVERGTDPLRRDTDGDRLDDGDEVTIGTLPLERDTDRDELPDGDEIDAGTNPLDDDTDGDGVLDGFDRAPLDPFSCSDEDLDLCDDCSSGRFDLANDGPDFDGDGLCDLIDPCDNGAAECDPCVAVGDAPDADGDGIVDGCDNCPDARNPLQEDTDQDGVGGACDNCRLLPNPDQADDDDDEAGDACDNCRGLSNPDQADADGDEIGDLCDLEDRDMDGLIDVDELRLGTDPDNPDSDDDGLSDGDEVNEYGTLPLDPDTDDDRLSDGDEVYEHRTKPTVADSDEDGLDDGDEITEYDTEPLDPDTDDDLLFDGLEIDLGTDPKATDSDGDCLDDGRELLILMTDPAEADDNADCDPWADAHDYCVYLRDREGPFDSIESQRDSDGDGVGDACDRDDGTSSSDDETQGMQLQGGCATTPGRAPGGGWWLATLLFAGLGLRRRRAGPNRSA